jgi:hypothetical protein
MRFILFIKILSTKSTIILVLLCFSCSSSNEFDYKEFSLTGREVGPTDFFGEPTSIISHKGYFVIADERTQDNLHYLNENFEILKSFGRPGAGPDEIELVVTFMPIQPFKEQPLRLLTGEAVKEIDLNKKDDELKLVKYPKDIVLTQKIVVVNDTIIWGQGGSDKFKFMVVNTNNAEVVKYLPFVAFEDSFTSDILPFAYHGLGFYHPWFNQVVWNHIQLNTIEFYAPNGDFEREWVFGAAWTEEELKNRYPVLLRSVPIPKGLLVMHIKEAKDLANNSTVANLYYAAIAKIKTRILFFNEEGEVKWSLKLDRFLNDFTFDVENKRIVGVFGESEKQNIVVYELPEDLLREIGF